MASIGNVDYQELESWYNKCPIVVQILINKFPPNRLYRLRGGPRIIILGYEEDGLITVLVSGKYNLVFEGFAVDGVNPSLLIECDLPRKGELLGEIGKGFKSLMGRVH